MNPSETPRIGLLPLILEMYKTYMPGLMASQKRFVARAAEKLGGFSRVSNAPICANSRETAAAVRDFESEGIDLIVVLYTAYAPSLAALRPLLDTGTPLLLFSTAPRESLAEGITMQDIMENHGVHGYMDLANVLRRSGRRYAFVSGSMESSAAWDEVRMYARAALARRALRSARVGIAGHPFEGMGDLGLDTTTLNARLGAAAVQVSLGFLAERVGRVEEREIQEENERDRRRFTVADDVDDVVLTESNRLYLGLRAAVRELDLDGFTMHFQAVLEHRGIRTVPFLGISKLQEQGIGYAGEGDVLTAAVNRSLYLLTGGALFTEPFCPDFDGNRILMGHMGESNPGFGTQTVLRRKHFQFGEALDPVVMDVDVSRGPATLVNLGIVEQGRMRMVLCTGSVCDPVPASSDVDMPFFMFRPEAGLEGFLTGYGRAGGAHHLGMVAGEKKVEISRFAELMDLDLVML